MSSYQKTAVGQKILAQVPGVMFGWITAFVISVGSGLVLPGIQTALNPPYHYSALAPACNSTQSGWQIQAGEAACESGELVLSVSGSSGTGEADFTDPARAFPTEYGVTVEISHITPNSCAGVLTRGHAAQASGYAFLICPSQLVWEIFRFEPKQAPYLFFSGPLDSPAQGSYTLTVNCQDSDYPLFVNGKNRGAMHDSLITGTENVSLLVSPSGSATFTNFDISSFPGTSA